MDCPHFLAEEGRCHIIAGWHSVWLLRKRSYGEATLNVLWWGGEIEPLWQAAHSPLPLKPVKMKHIWKVCVLLPLEETLVALSPLVLFTNCDVKGRKWRVWILISPWKSVTYMVSLGTISAYHSSAKVSRAQLVKQTLPKYNFRAYNTEYLTFHYSIPPKPKVYFLHSALWGFFSDKRKKK